MEIGVIGLGRMGLNMARRLARDGHRVVAYNRTAEATKAAEAEGIAGAYTLGELAGKLPCPRVIWMMVPAGAPVEYTVESLKPLLAKGDVLVDGGNSYYKDSARRYKGLAGLGISYVDAGVSGGIWGLDKGYCIMAGGDKGSFAAIEPLLKSLTAPEGYMYCGASGAGHFLKMVHNGIEYGLMEAYAEGFELMAASQYGEGLENLSVARLWNNGSVVRSWLLELMESAFGKEDGLESIVGYVEDSGEGRWMVKEAVEMGVSAPAITAALMRRFRSRQQEPFGEKVLAAMREEFGGHSVRRVKK